MSYSSDLWEGIEIIKTNLKNQCHELKNLFLLFEGIAALEQDYSNGLTYLYNLHTHASIEGVLGKSINSFLNHINKIAQVHKKTFEFVTQKILQPLDSHISFHINETNEQLNLYETNEKIFNSLLKDLLLKQEKFHEAAEEFSNASADTRISEISTTVKKSMRTRYIQAQNKKEEIAKKAKSDYISFLTEVNKKREKYNTKTKDILNVFQTMHSNVVSIAQWSITQYFDNSLVSMKELEQEQIQLKKQIEDVSGNEDIKEFVKNNATLKFPYYNFEFVPCKIKNINTYVSQDTELGEEDHKQIIKEVKKYISSELKYTPPQIEKNLETVYNNIEKLIKFIWEQGQLDHEQKSLLIKYLKDKENINCFIKCLNKLRSGGKFLLTNISYNCLVEIFMAVLDEKAYQGDFYVLKNMIILSQTFYKVGDNPATPNILIQIGIQNHKIWHKSTTWLEIIKYSIGEQDKKTREKVMFSKGTDSNEDRYKRLSTFASTTLVSYLCNMKLFGVSKEVLKETQDFLCKVYHLNEQEIIENIKSVEEVEEKQSKTNVKIGLAENDVGPDHKLNVKGTTSNEDKVEDKENNEKGQ